jgi:hypothetical protein
MEYNFLTSSKLSLFKIKNIVIAVTFAILFLIKVTNINRLFLKKVTTYARVKAPWPRPGNLGQGTDWRPDYSEECSFVGCVAKNLRSTTSRVEVRIIQPYI